MKNDKNRKLTTEVINIFYSKQIKKEKICLSVMFACVLLWGADIYYFDLFLLNAGGIYVILSILIICLLFVLFVRCPACNRMNFKQEKCSICGFQLTGKEL